MHVIFRTLELPVHQLLLLIISKCDFWKEEDQIHISNITLQYEKFGPALYKFAKRTFARVLNTRSNVFHGELQRYPLRQTTVQVLWTFSRMLFSLDRKVLRFWLLLRLRLRRQWKPAFRINLRIKFRYLGNCPPTPPLSQHFAPSEN